MGVGQAGGCGGGFSAATPVQRSWWKVRVGGLTEAIEKQKPNTCNQEGKPRRAGKAGYLLHKGESHHLGKD